MVRDDRVTVLEPAELEPGRTPPAPPDLGDGGRRESPGPAREPLVSNATIAMVVLLAFETMFFVGLLGAFIVLRLRSPAWPPPGQPYLPLAITWFNTGVLLFSGYTMWRALRAIRRDDRAGLVRWLLVTAIYGVTFLSVQGYEWVRLVGYGLTLSSSNYGALFYTLIGTHGLHVLAAVIWLLAVLALARRRRFSARRYTVVRVCGIYWQFVVALWPLLFVLVYLL
jgi:cytochrome c oxidase subunit III